MDKDKVIAAIKKNIVSILAGVVALVALGFMFFWVSPKISSTAPQAGSVKQRVAERAAKAQQITGLLNAPRPDIQYDTTGANTNLAMFPTNRLITAGREAMEGVKAQANEVLAQAEDINRRVPRGWPSYEAADADWPLEGDQKAVERDRYRREYAKWINADNSSFDPESGDYQPGTLQATLGATRPPTLEEIQMQDAGLEAMLKAKVAVDEKGNPIDPQDFAKRLAEGRIALAASLKYRRAMGHRMYVDPNGPPGPATTGFSVHPLATVQQATAVDCFNAQIGLWVQETVAQNLARANEEALAKLPAERQNLMHAPVKHLLQVVVPNTPFGEAKAVAPGAAGGEAPAPPPVNTAVRGAGRTAPQEPTEPAATEEPAVEQPASGGITIDATAAINRLYPLSPSGRPVHTSFYDLVQFRMTLRCDAATVPYVLEQLQASSFLTVLNVDMTIVDPAAAAQRGYVYGDRPVVELALQCEMPFLRSWLVPLMPPGLQLALAQAEQPPEPEY